MKLLRRDHATLELRARHRQVARPRQDLNLRVLVDRVPAIRAQRRHVPRRVRAQEDVLRVEEEASLGRAEAADAAVQHDVCVHVLQTGEAELAGFRLREALESLEAGDVEGPEEVVEHDQVGTVRTTN